MCKKKYSLIQSFIDNNKYDYVNKVKLKVWKELETKRLNMQLNSNENIQLSATELISQSESLRNLKEEYSALFSSVRTTSTGFTPANFN